MLATAQRYRLRQDALPAEQARAAKTALPAIIIVLVAGMLVSFFLSARSQTDELSRWITLLIGGVLVTWMVISIPIKTRRRLQQCWETYELEIGPDYLLRKQAGFPDLRIAFSDVRKVERVTGRYILITGAKGASVLGVPESIEDFPDVLSQLSAIATITERTNELWKRSVAIIGAGLALFLIAMWSKSPIIAVPSNLLCFALMIWAFVYMSRSANVSAKNRRFRWWYLLLAVTCAAKLLSVVGVLSR